MGIFDRAREALGQAAAAVSRETEVLSLQTQLGNTDTELEHVLIEVGKRARELYRAGSVDDREIGVLMHRVEELESKMMELRQQVQDVQNKVAKPAATPAECPRCAYSLPEGAKFCGKCGAKVE